MCKWSYSLGFSDLPRSYAGNWSPVIMGKVKHDLPDQLKYSSYKFTKGSTPIKMTMVDNAQV